MGVARLSEAPVRFPSKYRQTNAREAPAQGHQGLRSVSTYLRELDQLFAIARSAAGTNQADSGAKREEPGLASRAELYSKFSGVAETEDLFPAKTVFLLVDRLQFLESERKYDLAAPEKLPQAERQARFSTKDEAAGSQISVTMRDADPSSHVQNITLHAQGFAGSQRELLTRQL
jgi:hypothetical protein